MIRQDNLTELDIRHIRGVIKEISHKHDFTVRLVRSERRGPLLKAARVEISEILKYKYNCSYPVIGKFLNKDHSTIVYYLKGKPYQRKGGV